MALCPRPAVVAAALRRPPRRRSPPPSLRSRCSISELNPAAAGIISVRCSAAKVSGVSSAVEEELDPVLRFEMSDFTVCNHVSVGHHGRAGELIFEATVSDAESLLFNSTVVLRQLTSTQAQRRGRRALQVLKKLARRQLMYHSYAMQVHGYISPPEDEGDRGSFMLVHGYHGSYSLRHWLQLSDWLPTLEATLALDEEHVRRVGDDKIGGPAVTRRLRLIRIMMRDLLIGVNYLHSHGLAHTELRVETIHISPVDKHVKVGILGNAVDFYGNGSDIMGDANLDRRKLMIAFDMRCLGFIMAKMVLKELMDPSTFMKFKSFLTKENDPSCLREFLLPILSRDSPSGNAGIQMLDRNWGAGWNLLSLLLAIKPSERISCLNALRHPFLCGPRWRIDPSMDIVRWGLGSTAVRMAEDYIYGHHQRRRLAYFIELMELLNPRPRLKNWLDFLHGRWRLLYCTGRHIGLTLRQASPRVLIGSVNLTFERSPKSGRHSFLVTSNIDFKIMPTQDWSHEKSGSLGKLTSKSPVRVASGRRLYLGEDDNETNRINSQESVARKLFSKKWKAESIIENFPTSLPAAKLIAGDIDVEIHLQPSLAPDVNIKNVLQEVRTQIPPEMFDISKLVCGTYVDSRLMVLRGVNGSALLFTRSSPGNCR